MSLEGGILEFYFGKDERILMALSIKDPETDELARELPPKEAPLR